jgi:hypothetical protein
MEWIRARKGLRRTAVVASALTVLTGGLVVALEGQSSAATATTAKPNSGTTAGGTIVTVTGTGFTNAAGSSIVTAVTMAVTCGTSPTTVTTYNVVSGTKLVLTAPAHAAAAMKVCIVVSGTTGYASVAYTYAAPPTVTSITPSAGPAAGGQAVTVVGTGFAKGLTADIGGVPLTNIVVATAGTSFTAVTGVSAPTASAATLHVTSTGGAVASASAYTYDNAITVTPNHGPVSTATVVTINGSGFLSLTAPLTVDFSGTNATNCMTVSDTEITCKSPSSVSTAGPVTVTVTDSNSTPVATSVSSGSTYTFAAY